jgi:hypothetical protein
VSDAQTIVFSRDPNQVAHSFRHTDILGLDREEVMEAIRRDLEQHLPLAELVIGIVIVGGIELRYHAYCISKEFVNVGRITGT